MMQRLACTLLLLAAASAAAQATTTVSDVATARGTIRIAHYRPAVPLANLYVMSGGFGQLGLQANGTGTHENFTFSPFVRIRQALLDAGYSLVMIDAPSDMTGAGIPFAHRVTAAHSAELLDVIRFVQARDNLPAWMLGFSASRGPATGPSRTRWTAFRKRRRSRARSTPRPIPSAASAARLAAMEMSSTRPIAAPPEAVWQALNDPEVLKACIPGCESYTREPDGTWRAVVAARVGPVSARFTGTMELADVVEPTSYTMRFKGQGGAAGFAQGEARVSLAPAAGGTNLAYTARAQVGGKLAQIGSRLIDGAAAKLADDFFERFAARFGPAPEAQAAVTPITPPARFPGWLVVLALATFALTAWLL